MAGSDRETQSSLTTLGFADALRAYTLGVMPNAPRIPEAAITSAGTVYGGFQKGFGTRNNFRGSINFSTLRQLAERSPVLAAILSKRKFQISKYSRVAQKSKKTDVGFRIVHKMESDPKFVVDEGFKNLCRDLEASFMKPWVLYWNEGLVRKDIEPSLAGFMSKIVDDHLVINRPCIELGLDSNKIPRAFGAIDGANVLPTFAAARWFSKKLDMKHDFVPNSNQYREALQKISDKYGVNLTEEMEYIYLLGGRPYCGYQSDEIIVAPFFPVTDVRQTGYPKSLTEIALFIILAEIMAMSANAKYFETGSMSEVLIAMRGNYEDQHIKQLQDIFQANMSGSQNMFKVPIVALPGGADDINVVNLKQNHRDMLFDVYIQKLTNLACAVFSMHPSEINEAPRAGDNSGALQQAGQTLQIGMAQEQGLQTLLQHIKTEVFDVILERIDPNLVLEWDYGDNEQQQLDIMQKYASITTLNERRNMMGLEPVSKEAGGDVIDNSFVQQMITQKAAQEQQAQATQQQGQAPQGQPQNNQGEPPQNGEVQSSEETSGDSTGESENG